MRGDLSTKFERSYSVVPHRKKLVTNRIKRMIYHQYTCAYCNSCFRTVQFILEIHILECSQRRFKRGPIPVDYSWNIVVPNGNKTFGNLLRTRKYFTTGDGHMHIYSIPPMSRMNCKQKIVPKLCSDFIRVFSLTVATTFFGNHNQLSNFLNSNTVLNYQIEERSM